MFSKCFFCLFSMYMTIYVCISIGEFPVLQYGEDIVTTPSKITDYIREKVGIYR